MRCGGSSRREAVLSRPPARQSIACHLRTCTSVTNSCAIESTPLPRGYSPVCVRSLCHHRLAGTHAAAATRRRRAYHRSAVVLPDQRPTSQAPPPRAGPPGAVRSRTRRRGWRPLRLVTAGLVGLGRSAASARRPNSAGDRLHGNHQIAVLGKRDNGERRRFAACVGSSLPNCAVRPYRRDDADTGRLSRRIDPSEQLVRSGS